MKKKNERPFRLFLFLCLIRRRRFERVARSSTCVPVAAAAAQVLRDGILPPLRKSSSVANEPHNTWTLCLSIISHRYNVAIPCVSCRIGLGKETRAFARDGWDDSRLPSRFLD